MSAFLAMGGYGAYVWPALIATLAGLLGITAETLLAHRRAKALLDRLEAEARSRPEER